MLVHLEVLTVLFGQFATLGCLLDRQADAAAGEVEIDDLDPQLFAWGNDLLWRVDVVCAHLADVHETLDAFAHLSERTEWHQLGDAAVDQLANFVAVGEGLPRILLSGLERQADALAIEVDIEHLNGDWVANGNDSTRMINMLPRQLADVDETIHAAEVDERTEADDAADNTAADLAWLEVGKELVASFLLRLFEVCTTAEHNVVAVLVELDDLGLHHLAHVGLQVANATQLDERGGKEAAKADVDNEAALDDFDDETFDHAVGFFELFDIAPGTLVLSTLLGEQQATFFVFLGQNQCFDLFAELDDVVRVDVVTDAELAGQNDALALVTDVEQDFVAVDLYNGAMHQLAIVDFDECAGNRVCE